MTKHEPREIRTIRLAQAKFCRRASSDTSDLLVRMRGVGLGNTEACEKLDAAMKALATLVEQLEPPEQPNPTPA